MTQLARYFDLIGYRHDGAPSLAALRTLHLRHTLTIPFENLSPLAGQPVKLDLESLLDKFTSRRGGYCYEQNLVFKQALDALGFSATILMARVRLNAAPDAVTPRSHMLVKVDIGGESWIADTGFGRMTLTAPIRLEPETVQHTPHGRYRLMLDNGGYRLEGDTAGSWQHLYVFDLTPCYYPDCVVSNWYVSTHPDSHFTRDLVAVRATPAGRHVLNNARHSFYPLDGAPVVEQLASAREIVELLRTRFGIDADAVPGIHAKFEAIAAQNL